MRKLFMLSALALVITTSPAFADGHSDGEHHERGHKGGKMFEKHDANGDGVISKQEFMDAHEKKFEEIDADGNGEISREEMKARKAAWREKMKERRDEHREKRKERASEGDE